MQRPEHNQREPQDVRERLEFDLTVRALREDDPTTKVSREDDTDTIVYAAPWMFEDDPTQVHGSRDVRSVLAAIEEEASMHARTSVPPRARARGRALALLSLGVLCFAFGAVLADVIQGEPAGTLRRLPSSAALHEGTHLPAGQAAEVLQRPNTMKREVLLAVRDAGLQPSEAQRPARPITRQKVAGHAKRSRLLAR